jgi:hypothetical protein
MVWMTPYVYVSSKSISNPFDQTVLWLRGDAAAAGSGLNVHVTEGTVPAAATATCEFLLRLLATSELPSVHIHGCHSTVSPPISGAALSLFFQESRICLGKVLFEYVILNEDQSLALATMSRLDVEVKMRHCGLWNDAVVAFVKCLHTGRGL